ncbi:hypothetical protein SCA6_014958 [Theobroma cacao]
MNEDLNVNTVRVNKEDWHPFFNSVSQKPNKPLQCKISVRAENRAVHNLALLDIAQHTPAASI